MDVVHIAHGEVCSDVPPTVAMRMIQTVSNISLTLGKSTQLPNHILRHQNVCESSTHDQLMSPRSVDTLVCHMSVFSQQCGVIQRALGSRSEDVSPRPGSHTPLMACACHLTWPSVSFLIHKSGLLTPTNTHPGLSRWFGG